MSAVDEVRNNEDQIHRFTDICAFCMIFVMRYISKLLLLLLLLFLLLLFLLLLLLLLSGIEPMTSCMLGKYFTAVLIL